MSRTGSSPRNGVLLSVLLLVGVALIIASLFSNSRTADSDLLAASTVAQESEPGRNSAADEFASTEPDVLPEALPVSEQRQARSSDGGEEGASEDDLETLIRRRLSGVRSVHLASIDSVTCSPSECEIAVTTTLGAPSDGSDHEALINGLTEALIQPPFRGRFSFNGRRDPNGIYGFHITLDRNFNPGELPAAGSFPWEPFRRVAPRALPPDDYDAPPVRLGQWQEVEVFVENICSTNCPVDIEQVIRLELSGNQTCASVGGQERPVTVWSPTGLTDRTLCLPPP